MGRPKQPETMETVSVRLPSAMVAEIDAYLDKLKAETPLLLINRADAIRQLLAIALETERKGKRRKG